MKQLTEELQLQGTALNNHLNFSVGFFFFDSKPVELWRSRTVNNCPAAFTGQLTAGCIPSDGYSGISTRSKAL